MLQQFPQAFLCVEGCVYLVASTHLCEHTRSTHFKYEVTDTFTHLRARTYTHTSYESDYLHPVHTHIHTVSL